MSGRSSSPPSSSTRTSSAFTTRARPTACSTTSCPSSRVSRSGTGWSARGSSPSKTPSRAPPRGATRSAARTPGASCTGISSPRSSSSLADTPWWRISASPARPPRPAARSSPRPGWRSERRSTWPPSRRSETPSAPPPTSTAWAACCTKCWRASLPSPPRTPRRSWPGRPWRPSPASGSSATRSGRRWRTPSSPRWRRSPPTGPRTPPSSPSSWARRSAPPPRCGRRPPTPRRHGGPRRVPPGTLAARQLERPRPIWRRAWVVALAGVLVFGGSLAAWRLTSRQRTPPSVGGPDAPQIAVLYFEDQSPDKKLSYVADGLTDELIDQLAAVRALDVVSKNGVAPFRGSDIPRDSIARVLGVGTLVEGALEPTRSGVRLTVRLVDGNSGADIKRGSFDLAAGAPLALRDSLAGRVAQFLRERLGEEITLRRRQAGTQNQEAWSLLQQAERLARDAALRGRSNDTAGTGDLLRGADSLLAVAERLDPQWGEAVVAGGELALSRAQATSIPVQEVRWVDSGFARANRALALDAKDPAALELRGGVYYWRWFHRLAPDPKEAAGLLQRAETDLRQAVTLDPSRARAWYRLANVYFQKPDLAEGTLDIRRAYEEDAYLAEAEVILWRLYTTAYDNERFVDAVHWCDEGGRRFPANPLFVQCQLWTKRGLAGKRRP